MPREELKHLVAFLTVARERSFTRAAAQLGVSQSALSHTVRGLEARLGVRLLTRTTRSIAPTEAGKRLLLTVGPHLDQINAAPSYFAARRRAKTPQELTAHDCINLRLPTYGGLFAWEFEKNGHELKVRVEGQLVFNNIALRLNAALAGFGLTYLPEDMAKTHIAKRQLVRVLADWCPTFSGYHLYYPSRRQHTPAFSLLVDTLRYRG
jgi:DNA-binding transcriptional LysR family regulator